MENVVTRLFIINVLDSFLAAVPTEKANTVSVCRYSIQAHSLSLSHGPGFPRNLVLLLWPRAAAAAAAAMHLSPSSQLSPVGK